MLHGANSVIILDQNRSLYVKETVEELDALFEAAGGVKPVTVTQVKKEVAWKTPTPIDTKADVIITEVPHRLNAVKVVQYVPATEYVEGVRGMQ